MPDRLPFLPDEHHYAITNVVARAAQLDHTIYISAAYQLSDKPRLAKFLLANLDLNRLVGALHSALLDNFQTREDEINELMTSIRTARTERNNLIHWLWQKTDDPEIIKIAQRYPHKPDATQTRSAADLYALAQRLLDGTIKLQELDRDLTAARGAQARASLDTLLRQIPPVHSPWPESPGLPIGSWLFAPPPLPSQEKSEPES